LGWYWVRFVEGSNMTSTVFGRREWRIAAVLAAIWASVWTAAASAASFYVANGGDGSIKVVTSGGVVSTYATGLSTPRGLAFDSAGDLFVANNGDSTIRKILPGGVVTTFASGLTGLDLYGVAIDSTSGNIFVSAINLTTPASSSILEFTPAGVMSTFATLSSPGGLAFDSSHNLFVTLATAGPSGEATGGINEVSPGGVVNPVVTSAMSDPIGLALSGTDLYAAEIAGSKRVLHTTTTGGTVTPFATGFGEPYGATFGGDGRLYVTDFTNGLLDAVSSGGVVSTFAAGFSSPRFITVGPDVPEPGALALLAASAGLVLRRRRAGKVAKGDGARELTFTGMVAG
jgi:sugar lactone lactonase YvrE